MKNRWVSGNRFRLLENGEEFFPAAFAAIDSAQKEVLVETFILFEDEVGMALHAALLAASRRGVHVEVTVDGYGSPDLTPGFIGALTSAGVLFHVFDPRSRLFGLRTNVFRRLHRKIVVIDGERAFVGGINFSVDQLTARGPAAKQDYSVEIEGPIVRDIHRFAHEALAPVQRSRRWLRRPHAVEPESPRRVGSADAMFVTRDNDRHRDDIERHYRIAIRSARSEVMIANAYFFPGYRLLRELRRAARRGVRVALILQGQPDMPIAKVAAGMLYDHLLRAGVRIHEYLDRPLHAKVALADDGWATVGSSNLDPLSLSLNLEANVIIREPEFNRQLRARLEQLIAHSCQEVLPDPSRQRSFLRLTLSYLAFHFVRHFPAWAGWLPAHRPRIASVDPLAPGAQPSAVGGTAEALAQNPRTDRLTEQQPDYSA